MTTRIGSKLFITLLLLLAQLAGGQEVMRPKRGRVEPIRAEERKVSDKVDTRGKTDVQAREQPTERTTSRNRSVAEEQKRTGGREVLEEHRQRGKVLEEQQRIRRSEILEENRVRGSEFEDSTERRLVSQGEAPVREVYLEYRSPSGELERSRADFLMQDRKNPDSWILVEAKSSQTADFTERQSEMYSRIRAGDMMTVRSNDKPGLQYESKVRISEIRVSRPDPVSGEPKVATEWKSK